MVDLNLDFSNYVKQLRYNISRGEFAIGPRGNYLSQFKGEGTDFYGFRQYSYEDDAKDIDWLASSRSDKLLVREFMQEKSLHFIMMVDTSSSMFFGSANKLKCEYAAEFAAAAGFSIAFTGNNIGLAIFNKGIRKIMDSKRGMAQYQKMTSALSDSSIYGGEKDYNASFSYLMNVIKRRTIVFIISDFFGFGKDNEDYLRSMTGKFEVIGIMLRDRAETSMPSIGDICIEDPSSGEKIIVNTKDISREYINETRKQERYVHEFFLRNNLYFHKVYTDEDIRKAVGRLFSAR